MIADLQLDPCPQRPMARVWTQNKEGLPIGDPELVPEDWALTRGAEIAQRSGRACVFASRARLVVFVRQIDATVSRREWIGALRNPHHTQIEFAFAP